MANFRAYRKSKAKIKKIIDYIYIFKEIELINIKNISFFICYLLSKYY